MCTPEGAIACSRSYPAIYDRTDNFPRIGRREKIVKHLFSKLWLQDEGQDVAEYSVMLAVILVVIVGTIHLIGGTSNNIFSAVASSIVQ
jgi:Flp pilus assembly pilin Flp